MKASKFTDAQKAFILEQVTSCMTYGDDHILAHHAGAEAVHPIRSLARKKLTRAHYKLLIN